MTVKELSQNLYLCYSKELCYPKVREYWSESNKCFGMCAITTLIVNDFFGGNICKIYVDGISHYYNLIDNNIIDLTSEQFGKVVNYEDFKIIERNNVMTKDTESRYMLLKRKLEEIK